MIRKIADHVLLSLHATKNDVPVDPDHNKCIRIHGNDIMFKIIVGSRPHPEFMKAAFGDFDFCKLLSGDKVVGDHFADDVVTMLIFLEEFHA